MNKFIQLRGTFAVGKTSTARSFISRGNFKVQELELFGKKYPFTYDEEKQYIVTGRYDRNVCGGMDGVITNRDLMKYYLKTLMKKISPRVLVFEAVMYGSTYKFGKELSDLCKVMGYEYRGVQLAPPLEQVIENLAIRNGGKEVNYESLSGMYFSCFKATEKLRKDGIRVDIVNPREYSLDELHKIIEAQL